MGFKWFAAGLFNGYFGFAGEESAGASFLRRDGTVWTTDKDGPLLDLLAAEITARTGKDPGEHYRELTAEYGSPALHPDRRAGDARAEGAAAGALARGGPGDGARRRADRGEADPDAGLDEPIGGLKVVAASGWFAVRPSGTEDVYKLYAESFKDQGHLDAIVDEAQRIVAADWRSDDSADDAIVSRPQPRIADRHHRGESDEDRLGAIMPAST